MILLALIIGFVVRIYPRYKLRNVYVSDTYYHLFCAGVIRQSNFKIPSILPRVNLPHHYSYPYFYHFLLALFGTRSRLWFERNTGAIFDTISNVFFYIFIVNVAGYGVFLQLSVTLPVILALLVALSPAQLRLGSGPRAYNGSPRTLGQCLYLIHITSAYLAYDNQSLGWLIVSMLAGGIAIITAKFTLQVLLFFGLFISLLVSFKYLLLLCGCLIISIIVSRGQSLRIISGHIKHSIFYVSYLQKVFLFPHLNSLNHYIDGAKQIWRQSDSALKTYWLLISERYPLHIFVTVFPQFLLVPLYVVSIRRMSSIDKFMLAWVLAGLFCFVATKTRQLLFLGEGERYLEYSLYPSLYLALSLVMKASQSLFIPLIIAWIAYSIFCARTYLRQYVTQFARANEYYEQTERCFEILDKSKPGVIWPIGSFHYQALYRSKNHHVLSHGGNMQMSELDDIRLVYENYPYPSAKFVDILEKYNISYIVSDDAHVKHYKNNILKDADEFDSMTELLTESPVLKIWKIKSPATA